jgi:hypothetical protein
MAKKTKIITPALKGQLGAKPGGNPSGTVTNRNGDVFTYRVDKRIEPNSKVTSSPFFETEKVIENKGK